MQASIVELEYARMRVAFDIGFQDAIYSSPPSHHHDLSVIPACNIRSGVYLVYLP